MMIEQMFNFQQYYGFSDKVLQNINRFIHNNDKDIVYDDIKYNALTDCVELYSNKHKMVALPMSMLER